MPTAGDSLSGAVHVTDFASELQRSKIESRSQRHSNMFDQQNVIIIVDNNVIVIKIIS